MKLTLESTTQIVDINGVPARMWEGTSEAGVKVRAFITRLAVEADQDLSQFEAELQACRTPEQLGPIIPLRFII